jgi:hypothetical protein
VLSQAVVVTLLLYYSFVTLFDLDASLDASSVVASSVVPSHNIDFDLFIILAQLV